MGPLPQFLYPCGAVEFIYYLFIKLLFNKLNNYLILFKGRDPGPPGFIINNFPQGLIV
jgi:hypothetical protein